TERKHREPGQRGKAGHHDRDGAGQREKVVHGVPCSLIRRRRERRGNTIDPVGSSPYIARMALREILILPDKRLRLVSEPVKKIGAETRGLVEDMFETMYDAPGVGLAAI